MKAKTVTTAAVGALVCGALAFPVGAQEGHPMTGSWVGNWGLTATERHRVVIVIEWTGSELVGVINPGPDAIPIRRATADPNDWSLHIEADGTDGPWVIDGTIDDLLAYNRTIAGTWRVGAREGTFSITRQ
jgi:hypothetical protein